MKIPYIRLILTVGLLISISAFSPVAQDTADLAVANSAVGQVTNSNEAYVEFKATERASKKLVKPIVYGSAGLFLLAIWVPFFRKQTNK